MNLPSHLQLSAPREGPSTKDIPGQQCGVLLPSNKPSLISSDLGTLLLPHPTSKDTLVSPSPTALGAHRRQRDKS